MPGPGGIQTNKSWPWTQYRVTPENVLSCHQSHYIDAAHVTPCVIWRPSEREIPILIKSLRNANLKRNDVNLT